jgi:hypothetical protein
MGDDPPMTAFVKVRQLSREDAAHLCDGLAGEGGAAAPVLLREFIAGLM